MNRYMRIGVPEAGIKGRDKELHSTDTVGVITCPCPWYLLPTQKSSYLCISSPCAEIYDKIWLAILDYDIALIKP